jgi:hypothetical protein
MEASFSSLFTSFLWQLSGWEFILSKLSEVLFRKHHAFQKEESCENKLKKKGPQLDLCWAVNTIQDKTNYQLNSDMPLSKSMEQ